LGENIGDLGGVNAAYDGLQLYLKENGNPGLINGLTPEQLLFLGQPFGELNHVMKLQNQVKTDPHSPGCTPCTLQNIDAFYEASDSKKGTECILNQ
jgi:predicted metalloendopeptidase